MSLLSFDGVCMCHGGSYNCHLAPDAEADAFGMELWIKTGYFRFIGNILQLMVICVQKYSSGCVFSTLLLFGFSQCDETLTRGFYRTCVQIKSEVYLHLNDLQIQLFRTKCGTSTTGGT